MSKKNEKAKTITNVNTLRAFDAVDLEIQAALGYDSAKLALANGDLNTTKCINIMFKRAISPALFTDLLALINHTKKGKDDNGKSGSVGKIYTRVVRQIRRKAGEADHTVMLADEGDRKAGFHHVTDKKEKGKGVKTSQPKAKANPKAKPTPEIDSKDFFKGKSLVSLKDDTVNRFAEMHIRAIQYAKGLNCDDMTAELEFLKNVKAAYDALLASVDTMAGALPKGAKRTKAIKTLKAVA